jgi:hypothetical protein
MSDISKIAEGLTLAQRVLVCGGRDFSDWNFVWHTLDALRPITDLIAGGADGADHHAKCWAWNNPSVAYHEFPVDWKAHGRSAGPRRNQRMLDEGRPDLIVAFEGGRGTADMVRRARSAGVTVWEPRAVREHLLKEGGE